MAINSSGKAFVTGSVQSPDFPTTAGALQITTGSPRSRAFVASIETQTPACTFTASPASAFFYAGGGTGNFGVAAPSGCRWAPRASADWVTVSNYGAAGSGPLAIAAAANTGGARTASVTIERETITVTQAANGCSYSLSPSGFSFPRGGGPQSVSVTAGHGCKMGVTGLPLWLTASPAAVPATGLWP